MRKKVLVWGRKAGIALLPWRVKKCFQTKGGGAMGAKGKYQRWLAPEGLVLLEGWAREGLTDEQIAHNMGVHVATLYEWKKRFPELDEVLKKGKEVVDLQVENALLKRALGYAYEEVMEETGPDGGKRRVTRKHMAPDVTAQIFWLKNRRPDRWRDKPREAADESQDSGVVLLPEIQPLEEETD